MRAMADAQSAASRLVGSIFAGKYRVVQLLRTGGISDVFVAEQLTLRPAPRSDPPARTDSAGALARPSASEYPRARASEYPRAPRAARLALKVLRERFRSDRAVMRRFERGAHAAARVNHPNVVQTGPLERLPDGLPYLTMELLIGLDLADVLSYGHKIEPVRALRIARGAAEGLAAAHAAGVVHLDVKPENIFVVHEPDGSEAVKILDFGLAGSEGDPALSRVDAACGTPEYMAPEQRRGVPAAPSMDVYSLGVVLLEMLTGHPPTSNEMPTDLSAISSLDAPPGIASALRRALAPNPHERYASMSELLDALAGLASDLSRGAER